MYFIKRRFEEWQNENKQIQWYNVCINLVQNIKAICEVKFDNKNWSLEIK